MGLGFMGPGFMGPETPDPVPILQHAVFEDVLEVYEWDASMLIKKIDIFHHKTVKNLGNQSKVRSNDLKSRDESIGGVFSQKY